MGKTISEKIIAKAAGVESVKAGDIVWANVDKAMMDDILGPRVEIAEKMEELGASVKSPEKVVIISDHYTPPANSRQADIVKFTREWAKEKVFGTITNLLVRVTRLWSRKDTSFLEVLFWVLTPTPVWEEPWHHLPAVSVQPKCWAFS